MDKYIQSICYNCDPRHNKPGRTIGVDENGCCTSCGKKISQTLYGGTARWDSYFHKVCIAVASKSPCLSRQIGAILVKDKSIVSTGYNGPARDYPHCKNDICPRKLDGFKSGEGLEHCPAAHAEANCIANAARIGASTVGTTLHMNCVLPCKDCATALVNAGIIEIVIEDTQPYHYMSVEIFKRANVKIRKFNL